MSQYLNLVEQEDLEIDGFDEKFSYKGEVNSDNKPHG